MTVIELLEESRAWAPGRWHAEWNGGSFVATKDHALRYLCLAIGYTGFRQEFKWEWAAFEIRMARTANPVDKAIALAKLDML